MKAKDTLARFMERFTPVPESGCWLWDGVIARDGYGRLGKVGAHRVSFTLLRGPIPAGMMIDHLCHVPLCVNPDHLQLASFAETVAQGGSFHRNKTHCKNGHPYDDTNTYSTSMAYNRNVRTRNCRVCNAAAARSYRKRRTAP